jgi:hypothetical protein
MAMFAVARLPHRGDKEIGMNMTEEEKKLYVKLVVQEDISAAERMRKRSEEMRFQDDEDLPAHQARVIAHSYVKAAAEWEGAARMHSEHPESTIGSVWGSGITPPVNDWPLGWMMAWGYMDFLPECFPGRTLEQLQRELPREKYIVE